MVVAGGGGRRRSGELRVCAGAGAGARVELGGKGRGQGGLWHAQEELLETLHYGECRQRRE